MCSTSKLLSAIGALLLVCLGVNAQSGNAGGVRTTNSMSPGTVLTTDGTRMYWGPAFPGSSVTGAYSFRYPLELDNTNVSLRPEISGLTNFSASISNVVYLNSSSNIVSALSNLVSGTRYVLARGSEWRLRANSAKTNGLAAINIFNKQNVEIVGYGATIYTTNIGDAIFLTNCSNVEIRGLTVKGTIITNYPSVGGIGVVWGAIGFFACDDLRLIDNRILEHHDHGIIDWASQGGQWKPATTNVQVRFNYLKDGGSMRTNESIAQDGTALVPTGGDWTDNTIIGWLRGVEPYIDSSPSSALVQNTVVARNRIVNSMDDAILTAGSTNAHGLIIEDNVIEWHKGATWRGSNFLTSASGININGGQRVKILRNKIYNAPRFGISIVGDLHKHGYQIKDNNDEGHFYVDSNGGGIQIGPDSAIFPNNAFEVTGNYISNKRIYGLAIAGLRNSEVEGNTLVNTGTNAYTRALWVYTDGSIGVSNVAIRNTTIINDERSAGVPTRGIDIESGAKALRVLNTRVSGIATKVNNGAGAEVTIRNHDTGDTNQLATVGQMNGVSNVLYAAIGSGGGGGAGSLPMNANQFDTNATASIKNGALTTNLNVRTALTLPHLTASRAALINGSNQLTNSPNVSDVELEFLDGVTSALQTQLNGKMTGTTNASQFGASTTLTLKDGLLGTNWTLRGITLPTLTASRPAIIDASGSLTNATGTPDGTKFLRDDGTLAVPAGGSGSTNPVAFTAGSVGVSNYFGLGFTNTGSNAVQVIDMMGPPLVRSFANGNTTLVLTNMPAWTNAQYGGRIRIQLRHGSGTVTLASLHPINFGRSFFVASGETNLIDVYTYGQEVLGSLSHEPSEVQVAYASTIEIDQTVGQAVVWSVTNRMAGNVSLVLTNPISSRQLRINLIGEASGGTDRAVTLIPDTSSLAVNLDKFAQSKTNSLVFTLTNKNAAEISIETSRLNGTNLWKISVSQFSFQ